MDEPCTPECYVVGKLLYSYLNAATLSHWQLLVWSICLYLLYFQRHCLVKNIITPLVGDFFKALCKTQPLESLKSHNNMTDYESRKGNTYNWDNLIYISWGVWLLKKRWMIYFSFWFMKTSVQSNESIDLFIYLFLTIWNCFTLVFFNSLRVWDDLQKY